MLALVFGVTVYAASTVLVRCLPMIARWWNITARCLVTSDRSACRRCAVISATWCVDGGGPHFVRRAAARRATLRVEGLVR